MPTTIACPRPACDSSRHVQLCAVRDMLRRGATVHSVAATLAIDESHAARLLAEAMRIDESQATRAWRARARRAAQFVRQIASATGTRRVALVGDPTDRGDWDFDVRTAYAG